MAVLTVETPPALPVRIVRSHVELDNLVVAAAFRRCGVAQRLVEAAMGWAVERGLGEIELTVHEFNAAARAFYVAAGFHTVRRRLSLPVVATPC